MRVALAIRVNVNPSAEKYEKARHLIGNLQRIRSGRFSAMQVARFMSSRPSRRTFGGPLCRRIYAKFSEFWSRVGGWLSSQ